MEPRLDRIVVCTVADPAAPAAKVPPATRAAWDLLAREFPTVQVERRKGEPDDFDPRGGLRADVSLEAWEAGGLDLRELDRRLDRVVAERRALVVAGASSPPDCSAPAALLAILTRAQRLVRRRNRASTSPFFDSLLARHQDLYDPRARADFERALDVWQWVLRLAPEASLALQLAALFHDLSALRAEGRAGAEAREPRPSRPPHSPEPAAGRFGLRSRRQARESAGLAVGLLAAAGVHAAVVERAGRLIGAQNEPAGAREPELVPLVDAGVLSFVALDGPGLLEAGGPAPARQAIAARLARLSPAGRSRLAQLGLRPVVRRLLDDLERRLPPPGESAPPPPGAAFARPLRGPLIPR